MFERRKIGPNFNPEVGFYRTYGLERNVWRSNFQSQTAESRGVRELQFEGFILHAPDTQGEVSDAGMAGDFPC